VLAHRHAGLACADDKGLHFLDWHIGFLFVGCAIGGFSEIIRSIVASDKET
jgi:hypothetical protein